jgi:hypothetical protein
MRILFNNKFLRSIVASHFDRTGEELPQAEGAAAERRGQDESIFGLLARRRSIWSDDSVVKISTVPADQVSLLLYFYLGVHLLSFVNTFYIRTFILNRKNKKI